MTALAYCTGTTIATNMGASTDSVLDAIALDVNEIIEGFIGVPVGPAGTTARTYDGNGLRRMYIRGGLNSIVTLKMAPATGGTLATVASTDYVLRPHDHERLTGWPAFYIQLVNGSAQSSFVWGYDTIEITPGATSTTGFGWPAIPREMSRLAIVLGTRMWQARQSGETNVIGTNDYGQVLARFLPEPEFWEIIDRYSYAAKPPLVR